MSLAGRNLVKSIFNVKTNKLKQFSTSSVRKEKNTRMADACGVDIPPPAPMAGPLGKWTNFDVTESKASHDRWNWVLKLFGYKNEATALFRKSGAVYQGCVNQAALPAFYSSLQLDTDFRAQQSILMIHIWMIHRALVAHGDTKGKILQEQLFDRLWEDTTLRLRHQGIAELTINKYLNEIQQQCFTACVAYDKGLEVCSSCKNEVGLIAPIRKHVFNVEDGDGKYRQAKKLAKYMIDGLRKMEKMTEEEIHAAALKWPLPPKVSTTLAKVSINELVEMDIVGCKFGSNWRSALDISGKTFYWHETKRISSWELPKEVGKEQL